jgi:hypothetical protein
MDTAEAGSASFPDISQPEIVVGLLASPGPASELTASLPPADCLNDCPGRAGITNLTEPLQQAVAAYQIPLLRPVRSAAWATAGWRPAKGGFAQRAEHFAAAVRFRLDAALPNRHAGHRPTVLPRPAASPGNAPGARTCTPARLCPQRQVGTRPRAPVRGCP